MFLLSLRDSTVIFTNNTKLPALSRRCVLDFVLQLLRCVMITGRKVAIKVTLLGLTGGGRTAGLVMK